MQSSVVISITHNYSSALDNLIVLFVFVFVSIDATRLGLVLFACVLPESRVLVVLCVGPFDSIRVQSIQCQWVLRGV